MHGYVHDDIEHRSWTRSSCALTPEVVVGVAVLLTWISPATVPLSVLRQKPITPIPSAFCFVESRKKTPAQKIANLLANYSENCVVH